MDDLIYILLGLAWVIYAAYRANQKQKQKSMTSSATGPPASPREQPRPLDTIFGEILGEGSSLEEVSFPESQSYDDITVKELEEETTIQQTQNDPGNDSFGGRDKRF